MNLKSKIEMEENEVWDAICSSGKCDWKIGEPLPDGKEEDWIMVNYNLTEDEIDYCPAVFRNGEWSFFGRCPVIAETVIKWRYFDGD